MKGDVLRSAELIRDILCGLAFIHKHKIIHRDLHPVTIAAFSHSQGNILLSKNRRAKIADFGQFSYNKNTSHNGIGVGAPAYFSPEMLTDANYDEKTDIFR